MREDVEEAAGAGEKKEKTKDKTRKGQELQSKGNNLHVEAHLYWCRRGLLHEAGALVLGLTIGGLVQVLLRLKGCHSPGTPPRVRRI